MLFLLLFMFPALSSRTLAIYRLVAQYTISSGYTLYTIVHLFSPTALLSTLVSCMILRYEWKSAPFLTKKNHQNNIFDIFLCSSRQQQRNK